jgi:hypothetical protein
LDADVAFSPEEPLVGSLETALSAAGFEERLFGEQSPPVTNEAGFAGAVAADDEGEAGAGGEVEEEGNPEA